MMGFAFWSGLRISELIALTWEYIDLKRGTVKVCRAKISGRFKQTITKGSTREVELITSTLEWLQAQRHDPKVLRRMALLGCNRYGEICIWTIESGEGLGPKTVPSRTGKIFYFKEFNPLFGGERGIGRSPTDICYAYIRPFPGGPGEGLITTAFGPLRPLRGFGASRLVSNFPLGKVCRTGASSKSRSTPANKKGHPMGALFCQMAESEGFETSQGKSDATECPPMPLKPES